MFVLGLEQIEERPLLDMIGATPDNRPPAGSRDTSLAIRSSCDKFSSAPKSPRDPRLLVQIFRKRFGQPIGQRLGQDRVVIVVVAW